MNDEIDAAYRTKYRRYASSIIDQITTRMREPRRSGWCRAARGEHVTDEEYDAAPTS